jgi:hypothetical protein
MRTEREIKALIQFFQESRIAELTSPNVTLECAVRAEIDILLWVLGVPVPKIEDMVRQQLREESQKN